MKVLLSRYQGISIGMIFLESPRVKDSEYGRAPQSFLIRLSLVERQISIGSSEHPMAYHINGFRLPVECTGFQFPLVDDFAIFESRGFVICDLRTRSWYPSLRDLVQINRKGLWHYFRAK